MFEDKKKTLTEYVLKRKRHQSGSFKTATLQNNSLLKFSYKLNTTLQLTEESSLLHFITF